MFGRVALRDRMVRSDQAENIGADSPRKSTLGRDARGSSVAHARYLVRRIRRHNGRIKIIVGFWAEEAEKVDGEKIVGSTRNCHLASSIQFAIDLVCE